MRARSLFRVGQALNMAAECGGRLSDEELLSIDSQDDALLQRAIREKFQDGEPINILVTGKFKVGKSTLINTLFYKEGEPYEIAEDGFFDPTTEEVVPYQFETNGIVYKIYDSPGLQDDEDGENDTAYLNNIKENCPKLHLIIYCTKINDSLRADDRRVLCNLYSMFTEDILQSTVIALTHADEVKPARPNVSEDEFFIQILEAKKRELEEYFETMLSPTLAQTLAQRIFPTATVREFRLPVTDDWRVDFWTGCIEAARPGKEGVHLKYAWKTLLLSYREEILLTASVLGSLAIAPIKPAQAVVAVGGVTAMYGAKKAYTSYTHGEKKDKRE